MIFFQNDSKSGFFCENWVTFRESVTFFFASIPDIFFFVWCVCSLETALNVDVLCVFVPCVVST